MNPRIYHTDVDACLATWRNVQMSMFGGTLQTLHVPFMKRARDDLAATFPQSAVTLVVILPDCNLPNAEARKAVGSLMARATQSERAAAYVIEGSGVGATALRTMVSALNLAAGGKHPSKVFDKMSLAVPWLADQCNKLQVSMQADELLTAAHEVRNSLVTQMPGNLAAMQADKRPSAAAR